MSDDERLNRLIEPGRTSNEPRASCRNATRWGDLIFVSGKSTSGAVGDRPPKGRLDETLTVANGVAFAREAAIELLLVIRDELGSLDHVGQVLDVQGFVNADAAFEDYAKVLDGASDLLVEVLGEAGVHARSVFGAVSLRGGQPVILRAIVGVRASRNGQ